VALPPQNIIVVGGGPTGLMTTIHCVENVLASGGTITLYEARDSFVAGGSSYERAQIVRLDARNIALLRYHLGTGFEDVFIPASGETDSQLGNTL
jgi:glycine/D-amino acid oxidase-like deaminating enzyme